MAAVLVGLFALRFTAPMLTADVTVVVFSALSVGWLLMSLLVFGVDETVDPAKFALLPVRARELLPGLLAAGLIGVPGVATVLISARADHHLGAYAGADGRRRGRVPLGVVTCVLLARAATAAFAAVLASRRFRDLAFVGLALFGVALGLGGNLIGAFASSEPGCCGKPGRPGPGGRLVPVRLGLGDSGRCGPGSVAGRRDPPAARGRPGRAALVGLGVLPGCRLTSPVERPGESRKVRGSNWVDRLYPATPAGGVAGRSLRYWRRDPRYLAGIAGFLVAPVIIIVASWPIRTECPGRRLRPRSGRVAGGHQHRPGPLLRRVGVVAALSSGLRGADDRAGRIWAAPGDYLPVTWCCCWPPSSPGVAAAGARRPPSRGSVLAGLGVGSLVGALWQWPAPPPGANPFQTGNSGGLPALLSFTVTTFGTLIVSAPTIALVIWSFFTPWVGYLALPVGLASGLVVLRIGITQGGRMLDRRWPEALKAVSEKAG